MKELPAITTIKYSPLVRLILPYVFGAAILIGIWCFFIGIVGLGLLLIIGSIIILYKLTPYFDL